MPDLTLEKITVATGAPVLNVSISWPLILAALKEFGIDSPHVQIAAIATVAVETGVFLPITERLASQARQPSIYAIQQRYWPSGYYGRGFIQLTWKSNYERYEKLLGASLVGTPNLAATPEVAARILALFFKENRVDQAANNADWKRVRKIVNGGLVGWDKFIDAVNKLSE
jgi:predicted chitinase